MAVAALSAIHPTLLDLASRVDPNGKVAAIVETYSRTNEILQEMAMQEGNLPTGNRTTMRSGLPTVTWRLLNQGVVPSKSTTVQVDHTCGILEAWSEVDVDVVSIQNNKEAFRFSEATAFLEAMNQEMATTTFYGNQAVDPKEFTGFAYHFPYYTQSTPDYTESDYNCITNGTAGSSTNTSIYLVGWGPNSVFGFYPQGSQLGIKHESEDNVTANDMQTTPGRMKVDRDRFQWKLGLALRDWRYVVRICNIDMATISSSIHTVADSMIKAVAKLPSRNVNLAWYMNADMMTMLQIQAKAVPNVMLQYENWQGKPVTTVQGIPVRRCDAIISTEAAVTQAS